MIEATEQESEHRKEGLPHLFASELSSLDGNDPDEAGALLELDFPTPLLPDEDSLFEYFRDLGERKAGLPITVLLRQDRRKENDLFLLAIRSLFRASVYGEFSLLLGGILSEEDAVLSLQAIHEVFCELESEGREFNGYIPKGFLIDTPLALKSLRIEEGVDFFCLDFSQLLRLLTGRSAKEISLHPSLLSAVLEEIAPFYERIPRESIKKTARIPESLITAPVLTRLCQWNTEELFLPRKSLEEAHRILKTLGMTGPNGSPRAGG